MTEKVPTIKTNSQLDEISASSSWEGDAGKSKQEDFSPSDSIELPIGVMKDGANYRRFILDEMGGVDDHLVAKKSENNGAKAMSLVICRSVQEVEGLLARKQNPDVMFDRELARSMTQPDRDFLVTRIFMLSGRNDTYMTGECPRCGRVTEKPVRLSDLEVVRWSDDKPRELPFELVRGVETREKGKSIFYKKGILRFPTGKEQELTGKMDNPAEIFDSLFTACARFEGLDSLDTSMVMRMKRIDRDLITDLLKYELPGIRQWEDFDCSCGCNFEIHLDLASFFVGRRRRKKE